MKPILLLLALCLPAAAQISLTGTASISGAASFSTSAIPDPPAANDCAASTNYASADSVFGTSWSASGGPATLWECLDEARGSTDTTDSAVVFTDTLATPSVIRVTLSGTCDVTNITIYTYCQSLDESDVEVRVSPDNATWTTAETMSLTGTAAEKSAAFTGLSWTNPSYCYVKLNGAAVGWKTVIFYNMQVMVNP